MNIVITGTSKGIGLELCQIALRQGHQVCAIARSTQKSKGLQLLKKQFTKELLCVDLDVTSDLAGETILNNINSWSSLELLINNAGVLDQGTSSENLLYSFQVNSIAPFLITQALLPKLKKSAQPKVAHITSKMGSISDVQSGGYYGYRASKAALNMINKCLAMDHQWLKTLVIHPGWVKTDMGGSAAPVEIVDSANGIWKLISNLNYKSQSGQFFDYQGNPIPW